jgi:hypothetical protein
MPGERLGWYLTAKKTRPVGVQIMRWNGPSNMSATGTAGECGKAAAMSTKRIRKLEPQISFASE